MQALGSNAVKLGTVLSRSLYTRLGLSAFAYHVPAYANSFPYLLGGITLVGLIVLGISGIYLAQFYHPDPGEAHASVGFISEEVPFGGFVRGVHFWSSHVVMITLILHLLRAIATRAFRPPREVLWLVGVGLLVLMMALFCTGTVLKWDQEGYEALLHNEELGKLIVGLGAWFTSEYSRNVPLLTRVYVAHVGILPALLVLFMAAHLVLIRIHGMAPPLGREAETRAELQAAARGETAPGVSHFNVHILRVLGFGLLLTALSGVLALVLAPPLGPEPTPGMEVTKASWVFIWLYPLENWWGLRPLLWVPVAFIGALMALPFVSYVAWERPRWWVPILAFYGTVFAAMVALGIYGWLTTPAKHIME
jgi:ubiquinol-cytochrome c reductase cytochrome b subunit